MPVPSSDGIAMRTGQWIAVGSAAVLERIELCLTNRSGRVQQVDAVLVGVEHIWDYRTDTGRELAPHDPARPAGREPVGRLGRPSRRG